MVEEEVEQVEQQDPPSKTRLLYDAVSKEYDLGKYEEFESKLQDPAKRKAFYEGVGKEYDLGTYEEFESKVGVKKKSTPVSTTTSVQSEYAPPSTEVIEEIPEKVFDPIAESLKAQKLRTQPNAKNPAMDLGAIMGDVPKMESLADIDASVIKAGFNPEELAAEYKDFPEEAFAYNSRENMLKLKKENPVQYQQLLGTIKNQFEINKVAGVEAGNEYNALNQPTSSLSQWYDNKKQQQHIINVAFSGEQRDKANQRLEAASSPVINVTNPDLLEEYKSSNFATVLDPNQFAGLKTMELFHPEQYEQAVNFLTAKLEPKKQLSQGLTFGKDGFHIGDVSEKDTDETVAQEIGLETVKQNLSDIGRRNAMLFINKQQSSLAQAITNASPEEEKNIVEQYNKNIQILNNIQQDIQQDDERYPLSAQLKFDNQVKELVQKSDMNPLEYGVYRFGKGFEKTGNTLNNVLTSALGSKEDNAILQMQRLGELKTDESTSYLPESLRGENSPVITNFEKPLKEKVDAILNGRDFNDLPQEEKDSINDLVSKNQDQVYTITNPEAGKHKNFFSKSTLYSNAGMLGDIGSIAAQSLGLGAVGAGRLVTASVPMFTTTQDDFYRQAVAEGNPNPSQYANTHATIMAAAGLINPKLDIVKKALGINTAAGKLIAGIDEKTWDAIVNKNKPILEKFKNSAANVGKEAGKMIAVYGAGTSLANDLTDNALFNKNISGTQMMDNAIRASKDIAISSVALMGIGAISNFKSTSLEQKARVWDLGDNKELAVRQIDDAVKKGEITPQQAETKKSVIEEVSTLIDKVPVYNAKGKILNDKERINYFYNLLISNKAKQESKNLPGKQKEELEHTALVEDYKNELILDPKTDKQLEDRLGILERELEPKKDPDGKVTELPEKEKAQYEAEIEAIKDVLEKSKNEKVYYENNERIQEEGKPEEISEPIDVSKEEGSGVVDKASNVGGDVGLGIQQGYAKKAMNDFINSPDMGYSIHEEGGKTTFILSEAQVRSANGLKGGDRLQPHEYTNIELTKDEKKQLNKIESDKELGDIDGLEYAKQKRALAKKIFERASNELQQKANEQSLSKQEVKDNTKQPTDVSKEEGSGVGGDEKFTAKGGNKVVDEKGEPITVYHTTKAKNISEFKTSGEIETLGGKVKNEGAYFTPIKGEYANKGGYEYAVQISIKNPYITTDQIESAIISPEKRADLISKGHDGVILMRNGKPAEYVVFDKSQIKAVEQSLPTQEVKDNTKTTISKEQPTDVSKEEGKRTPKEIEISEAEKPPIELNFDVTKDQLAKYPLEVKDTYIRIKKEHALLKKILKDCL